MAEQKKKTFVTRQQQQQQTHKEASQARAFAKLKKIRKMKCIAKLLLLF